jgi:hypothetical protein
MAYPIIPGRDCERTTLVNSLAQAGVESQVFGGPFSEAWVLGLGGGLGATYILWEFRNENIATVVLAFGYRANYPKEHLSSAATRCGAKIEILETGSKKVAWSHLQQTIESGRVATCLVDPYHLPHMQIPASSEGCCGWFVNCFRTGDHVSIHDIGTHDRTLSVQSFVQARASIGSYKNRLVRVSKSFERCDISAGIVAAIGECCDYLGSSSTSFGLQAIRKWARLMTDEKHKKGWSLVFADGSRLFGALSSIYNAIKFDPAGGGGMRDLYAEFLREAGDYLKRSEYAEAANAYHACAKAWDDLAEKALPSDIFGDSREALADRYELITQGDDRTRSREVRQRDAFDELAGPLNKTFPLGTSRRRELYESIQDALVRVYQKEKHALELLRLCR